MNLSRCCARSRWRGVSSRGAPARRWITGAVRSIGAPEVGTDPGPRSVLLHRAGLLHTSAVRTVPRRPTRQCRTCDAGGMLSSVMHATRPGMWSSTPRLVTDRRLKELLSDHLPLRLQRHRASAGRASPTSTTSSRRRCPGDPAGLPGLRDADRFRSWAVASPTVRCRTTATRWRDHRRAAAGTAAEDTPTRACRLRRAHHRRLAGSPNATPELRGQPVLGPDYRQHARALVAGAGRRADPGRGVRRAGPQRTHTAVRLQRMRAHLNQVRTALAAWQARPRCAEAHHPDRGRDDGCSSRWLKRLSWARRRLPAVHARGAVARAGRAAARRHWPGDRAGRTARPAVRTAPGARRPSPYGHFDGRNDNRSDRSRSVQPDARVPGQSNRPWPSAPGGRVRRRRGHRDRGAALRPRPRRWRVYRRPAYGDQLQRGAVAAVATLAPTAAVLAVPGAAP